MVLLYFWLWVLLISSMCHFIEQCACSCASCSRQVPLVSLYPCRSAERCASLHMLHSQSDTRLVPGQGKTYCCSTMRLGAARPNNAFMNNTQRICACQYCMTLAFHQILVPRHLEPLGNRAWPPTNQLQRRGNTHRSGNQSKNVFANQTLSSWQLLSRQQTHVLVAHAWRCALTSRHWKLIQVPRPHDAADHTNYVNRPNVLEALAQKMQCDNRRPSLPLQPTHWRKSCRNANTRALFSDTYAQVIEGQGWETPSFSNRDCSMRSLLREREEQASPKVQPLEEKGYGRRMTPFSLEWLLYAQACRPSQHWG